MIENTLPLQVILSTQTWLRTLIPNQQINQVWKDFSLAYDNHTTWSIQSWNSPTFGENKDGPWSFLS